MKLVLDILPSGMSSSVAMARRIAAPILCFICSEHGKDIHPPFKVKLLQIFSFVLLPSAPTLKLPHRNGRER